MSACGDDSDVEFVAVMPGKCRGPPNEATTHSTTAAHSSRSSPHRNNHVNAMQESDDDDDDDDIDSDESVQLISHGGSHHLPRSRQKGCSSSASDSSATSSSTGASSTSSSLAPRQPPMGMNAFIADPNHTSDLDHDNVNDNDDSSVELIAVIPSSNHPSTVVNVRRRSSTDRSVGPFSHAISSGTTSRDPILLDSSSSNSSEEEEDDHDDHLNAPDMHSPQHHPSHQDTHPMREMPKGKTRSGRGLPHTSLKTDDEVLVEIEPYHPTIPTIHSSRNYPSNLDGQSMEYPSGKKQEEKLCFDIPLPPAIPRKDEDQIDKDAKEPYQPLIPIKHSPQHLLSNQDMHQRQSPLTNKRDEIMIRDPTLPQTVLRSNHCNDEIDCQSNKLNHSAISPRHHPYNQDDVRMESPLGGKKQDKYADSTMAYPPSSSQFDYCNDDLDNNSRQPNPPTSLILVSSEHHSRSSQGDHHIQLRLEERHDENIDESSSHNFSKSNGATDENFDEPDQPIIHTVDPTQNRVNDQADFHVHTSLGEQGEEAMDNDTVSRHPLTTSNCQTDKSAQKLEQNTIPTVDSLQCNLVNRDKRVMPCSLPERKNENKDLLSSVPVSECSEQTQTPQILLQCSVFSADSLVPPGVNIATFVDDRMAVSGNDDGHCSDVHPERVYCATTTLFEKAGSGNPEAASTQMPRTDDERPVETPALAVMQDRTGDAFPDLTITCSTTKICESAGMLRTSSNLYEDHEVTDTKNGIVKRTAACSSQKPISWFGKKKPKSIQHPRGPTQRDSIHRNYCGSIEGALPFASHSTLKKAYSSSNEMYGTIKPEKLKNECELVSTSDASRQRWSRDISLNRTCATVDLLQDFLNQQHRDMYDQLQVVETSVEFKNSYVDQRLRTFEKQCSSRGNRELVARPALTPLLSVRNAESESTSASVIPSSDIDPAYCEEVPDCEEGIDLVPPLKRNTNTLLATDGIHDESDLESVDEIDHFVDDKPLPFSMSFASSVKLTMDFGRVGGPSYPGWRFSVHGANDAILFDFSIYIGESLIPNAGMGAFLVYMGARKLKPERAVIANQIVDSSVYYSPKTKEKLFAETPDGRTVAVRLHGENLHGNYNCQYWPRTAIQMLQASFLPHVIERSIIFRKAVERIKIVGSGMESHPELATRSAEGIGNLGLYCDQDYEHVPGVAFAVDLCIDLGIYGPLSKTDRKPDYLYEMKSFIYSHGPSDWAYNVPELIRGYRQTVDITDDLSGEPHDAAQKEIPMYVNEVGHNSGFVQNVFVRDEDDRTVHYFFKSPKKLHGGQQVELLTNYGQHYEPTRERKGYGLKNLLRSDRSDDDLSSLLRRNFTDRRLVEEKVFELSYSELWTISRFITDIWVSLANIAKSFLPPEDHMATPTTISTLTCLQWKAMFRICWLKGCILRRLKQLRERDTGKKFFPHYCEGFIDSSCSALSGIEFSVINLSVLLVQDLLDRHGGSILKAVSDEIGEEMFYKLRHRIRRPFCDALWCPLGCQVLDQLKNVVVVASLAKPSQKDTKFNPDDFLGIATNGTQRLLEVIEAGGLALQDLAFGPGVRSRTFPRQLFANHRESRKVDRTFCHHSTMPKAICYFLSNGGESSVKERVDDLSADTVVSPTCVAHAMTRTIQMTSALVVVASNEPDDALNDDGLHSLRSALHPLSTKPLAYAENRVSLCWYMVWQVAYPICEIAKNLLSETNSFWLQGELARRIPDGPTTLQYAILRGMESEPSFTANPIIRATRSFERAAFRATVRQALTSKKANVSTRNRTRKRHSTDGEAGGIRKKVKAEVSDVPRQKPPMIYCGPPTVALEYPGGWPKGWIQKTFQRCSGSSAGHTDNYFYSPQLGIRIRSKVDLIRFLELLEKAGGDESKLTGGRFKPA